MSTAVVFSREEALRYSRIADLMMLFILFFVVVGSYHIHGMLTWGDWDFWIDWKDRRLWPTVTPILSITFPAAAQAVLWERFRLPWGATVCTLAILFGEWVNRYFNFWGWTYFPISFVTPTILTHMGLYLDAVLALSGSYVFTAVVGGLGWGLLMYPGNWPWVAPMHVPAEYNGMVMTLADIQGYHYVRTGTPEYIRMVEKGTLRTFGRDVVPVSAFFSGFMSVLVYFMWHFVGRWFGTTRFVRRV